MNEKNMQAMIQALQVQRNQAMDAIAQMHGLLAERDAEIAALKDKLSTEPKEEA